MRPGYTGNGKGTDEAVMNETASKDAVFNIILYGVRVI